MGISCGLHSVYLIFDKRDGERFRDTLVMCKSKVFVLASLEQYMYNMVHINNRLVQQRCSQTIHVTLFTYKQQQQQQQKNSSTYQYQ